MRRVGLSLAGVLALVSCSDPTVEAPRDAGFDASGDGSMDGATADGEVGSPDDAGPSECPVGAAFATGSAEGFAAPMTCLLYTSDAADE